MSQCMFRSKTYKVICPVCCGKVLEGVQLQRNAALDEAGHAEIALRLPLTMPRSPLLC